MVASHKQVVFWVEWYYIGAAAMYQIAGATFGWKLSSIVASGMQDKGMENMSIFILIFLAVIRLVLCGK